MYVHSAQTYEMHRNLNGHHIDLQKSDICIDTKHRSNGHLCKW